MLLSKCSDNKTEEEKEKGNSIKPKRSDNPTDNGPLFKFPPDLRKARSVPNFVNKCRPSVRFDAKMDMKMYMTKDSNNNNS